MSDKPDEHDIIYVLRTAQQHHVQLSAQADQKAQILIGASLVVSSFVATQFDGRETPAFALILALTLGIAAIISVLVIAPQFRPPKHRRFRENLLFFGDIVRLDEGDYVRKVADTMPESRSARERLAVDIWQLAYVVSRKYRRLRVGYLVLLCGLILSMAAFFVEAIRR